MILKTCSINQELSDLVQDCQMKRESTKQLVASVVRSIEGTRYNAEMLDKLVDKHNQAEAEFNAIFPVLTQEFAPEFVDRADVMLEVNYSKREIVFYTKDACKSKGCASC